jgi:hypothetical protein
VERVLVLGCGGSGKSAFARGSGRGPGRRIDWVHRGADVTEFRFRSALPGLEPGPKIVSRVSASTCASPDRPENRLARRFSTFEACFACAEAAGRRRG